MYDTTVFSFSARSSSGPSLTGTTGGAENSLQLTDIVGNEFAELFASQYFSDASLAGLQQPANLFSLPADGSLLPDGKNLPPVMLDRVSLDRGNGVAGTDPDTQTLMARLRTIGIEGEAQINGSQNEKALPVVRSFESVQNAVKDRETTQRDNLVSQNDRPLLFQEQDKIDLSVKTVQDPVTARLFQIGESFKSHDNPALQTERPLVNVLSSTESVNHRQSTGPTIQTAAKLSIDTPLNQPAWGESLSGKISWMIMENRQSAQININPPELGPIEVKLRMTNDQASISFVAQHAEARDAIEEAFPRLRDMLSQSGINLGESNVSQHSHENMTESGDTQEHGMEPEQGIEAEGAKGVVTTVSNEGAGSVDHYV